MLSEARVREEKQMACQTCLFNLLIDDTFMWQFLLFFSFLRCALFCFCIFFCRSCHVKHITRLFNRHIASSKNFQRGVPGICVKQLKWNVACVCVFVLHIVPSLHSARACVCASHSSFDFYFPLNRYRKPVFDLLQAGFNGNKNMSKPIN